MEGKKTGPDTRLMAEENDPQEEPSMEEAAPSGDEILSTDSSVGPHAVLNLLYDRLYFKLTDIILGELFFD